jgi:hypothetical protein
MPSSVVVDGSVLCGVDAGRTFDYERLRHAIRDIRDGYDGSSLNLKVFIDASLRWKLSTLDRKSLEEDLSSGLTEQAPAGLAADAFILRWAESHGAVVVTNDLYRDWAREFPWIEEKGTGRFVSGVYDGQLKKWTFLERYSNGSPRTLESLLKSNQIIPQSNKFIDPTKDKYKQAITRHNPTAAVFLIDQSGSMRDRWSNGEPKSSVVTSYLNDALYELVLTCTRQDGVRPYVDVAIIGYGGDEQTGVRSLLPGTSIKKPFLPVSEIVDLATFSEGGDTGVESDQPKWVSPVASGGTPMNRAFSVVEIAVKQWITGNENSFPPIVFNITDGESTDGDPTESAMKLTQLATRDGNTLLFNAHISAQNSSSIVYPEQLDASFDRLARTMFQISSHVPHSIRATATELGIRMEPAARGFLYNASASDVLGMLNVGSPATRVNPQDL